MRASFAFLLAALLALATHVPGDAKDDEKKAEADPYILFRVAGRHWLLKRTPKPGQEGGDTGITYHQFEVKSCYPEKAELGQLQLDAAKKGELEDEYVMTVELKEGALFFRDPIGFKKGKVETVKTDAGDFECTVWASLGREDGDAYIWRSNDFPGLVVKQDDRFGTRVVTEFDWVEGDPGYKPDKKKKKKPEPDKIDEKRLYSTKGALWIHRVDTSRGERGTRTIEVTQYEVKKVEDTQCQLEVTKLTQLLQKLKEADPETRIIKFDDTFKSLLQPNDRAKVDRNERRITKVGLFECTVYSFKDDEGRTGMAWYATKWPGLLLKREVKGEKFHEVTELVKFEE